MTSMAKDTIALVTGNENKASEISTIIGWPIEAVRLELNEIQSLTVEDVAKEKALVAYEHLGRPVIVDDTGMHINALNGLPGAFVSWFLDRLGPSGILRIIKGDADRTASVVTCIAYADHRGVRTFLGEVRGTLSDKVRGESGFGYDSIFVPNGHSKTYAEMSPEEKNAASMRSLALVKFKRFLEANREVSA